VAATRQALAVVLSHRLQGRADLALAGGALS
jgi:hypothetical protein